MDAQKHKEIVICEILRICDTDELCYSSQMISRPIRMKALIKQVLFLTCLISLSGCSSDNHIKELDCISKKVVFGKPAFGIGAKSQYIINQKTGEFYDYDEFAEKLKPLTGSGTTEGGWKYMIKSTIVDKKWKKQEIIEGLTLEDGSKDKGKSYFEIDLNTMNYSETNYNYGYNWEKVWVVEGACSWKQPKTTKILNKE